MAKPTKYSDALLDRICQELAKGRPLTVICRELTEQGQPLAPRTVRDWINERDADGKPTERAAHVSAAVAAARELGEEALAEECLVIADTPMEGQETKTDAEGKVVEVKSGDMLGHRKLQIETRLKLLAKFNPKRWGDKVSQEISGPGGTPVQTVTRIELVAATGPQVADDHSPD
ncbi:hypothetical protein ACM9XA_11295 [Xanthomonas sacchari]